ncbi:MAG: RluA family pseudouridine synthase [Clostridia bacterium]|nr:RluA family pseudouridine synthase [Clostridia bacterium]
MKLKYTVKESDNYQTIKEILSLEFHLSSRLTTKLIKTKQIYKNGILADTRSSVVSQDCIVVNLDYEEDTCNIVPTKMNLDILYEDEWFLVVNKPAGIAIHPSRLHYDNSLSNGIRYYFDSIHLKKKIRPVNRLDFDTSGLVIFAKCEYIQQELIHQMSVAIFKKEYLCLVEGFMDPKEGKIDLPIARKEGSIIERCTNTNGQKSVTHYKVIQEFKNCSFVQCQLETGRTHQIRVHMKAIGHPILGDTLYGNASNLVPRQALHSYQIMCIHPVTKNKLNFMANLPKDMKLE